MRILLIHNFYQQFGGEDVVALAERKILEAHNEDVFFYSRHNDEIRQFGPAKKFKAAASTVYSRETVRDIASVVERFHPEVAYVQNVYPLISPAVYHALRSLGVPVVQYAHDFRFLCPNGWFFTHGTICERCKGGNYLHAVVNRCYRESYVLSSVYAASVGISRATGVMHKLAGIICMTEFYRRKFLEVGMPEEKLFIKPNFVDTSGIKARPGKGDYVLFMGRLSLEKGLWTLVRAFEGLRDVPLRIAGTGPMHGVLQEYIEEKRLDHISLVGFKAGREKVEMLRNSIFTVVPSECYENFPTTALESYAAGKPVIGSNLGGMPFIIENEKSGLVFRPGDIIDLREKITHLISESGQVESMGKYARSLAETRYSAEESYRTLIGIFSKVSSLN